MLFPGAAVPGPATRVDIAEGNDGYPLLVWAGCAGPSDASGVPVVPKGPGIPLLGEHARGLLTRPHLRGHRIGREPESGLSWSTSFVVGQILHEDTTLRFEATDDDAGLALTTELESLPGGALRARCIVTNTAPGTYVVDGLEVVLPVGDEHTESLDFTGRHERERSPQRRGITDGLWLRESRGGRPGLAAATQLVVGTSGFSPSEGTVVGAHVAWSGGSVLRLERDAAVGTTLGGGELLMPGEVRLIEGASYATPWVCFASATDGLDGLAASWHAYQRSFPMHPSVQPVVLNVWEAVFFEHDFEHLAAIADRAARVGVELYVLDDGWFRGRRDDEAGLGDWYVDEELWPVGLSPLVDHVRSLGMSFGLWFEPEMVNPDSDLYRKHPDWILSSGGRVPIQHRNQLVLDLSNPEVCEHLFERMDAVLSAYPISFVKWDHNREIIEGGSSTRGWAPALHGQTNGFYALLDRLRSAHPTITWESCASGGGRIDLGVLERVHRVWTSDMTDALARQEIQRWSAQLVAPEYLGAHVSAPHSHTTGRTLSLDFRCATALFGSFGIEWDLTQASDDDLEVLASWIARYKEFRPLLHSGRVVRPASSDPTVLLHGVVAADRSEALMAHVAMDESHHNRGVFVRVPGLDPEASYQLSWEGPVRLEAVSGSGPLAEPGPSAGDPVTGAALATRGYWIPRRRPETVTLVHLTRAP